MYFYLLSNKDIYYYYKIACVNKHGEAMSDSYYKFPELT